MQLRGTAGAGIDEAQMGQVVGPLGVPGKHGRFGGFLG